MQSDELTMLVEQARRGNSQAFIDLMASAQRDLRVFIGTFACTAAMCEHVFADTLAEARRQLIDCPATPAIFTWLRQLAMSQLARRLDEERGLSQSKHDLLAGVVASTCEQALQEQASPSNSAGQSVGVRYGELPENFQRLISSRYGDEQGSDALGSALGMTQSDLAEAFYQARSSLDWKGVPEVVATTPSFPGLVDGYITGRLDDIERAALSEEAGGSSELAARFVRQVRVDLLLHALFGPITRDQVQRVVAKLGGGHESSRLMMGPAPSQPQAARPDGAPGARRATLHTEVRRNSGARSRPPTSSVHKPVRPPIATPRRGSGQVRVASGAALPQLGQEDDVPPPSRTPLYLAIGAVLVGLIATVAIWAGSSARGSSAAPGTDTPPPAAAAGFGTVERAIGDVGLVIDGKRQAANVGDAVAGGSGAQTAAGGVLSVQLEAPAVHVTLSGDTLVDHLAPGSRVRIQLDHGRLDIAAVDRTASTAPLEIVSPLSRVTVEPGKCMITCTSGRCRVEVAEGTAELARADGTAPVRVRAGQSASVVVHTDPVLDEAAVFVRGIAFGGGSVSIAGNAFLSKAEAVQAGLTIAPGATEASDGAISSPRLDFDLKAMLDGGLSSVDSRIHFSQVVPNGTYDVQLWIANEKGVGDIPPRVSVQGAEAPVAPAQDHAPMWCALGPFRGTVTGRSLTVDVEGLGRSRLCGVAIYTVGHPSGALPPLVTLASPLADAEMIGDVPLLARVVGSSDVAQVTFLDGDRPVAQAKGEPYRGVWMNAPAGRASIRVQVTDNAGGTVLSQPVSFTVKDPLALGLIKRETWNGIPGGSIKDLTNRPEFPDHPSSVTYDTAFFFPETQIPNFGTRMRGYLHPPSDGQYVFWVSGDDNCELYLSTDQTSEHRQLIARVPGYTGVQDWNHDPAQQSSPITLRAAGIYYIEALHKQGGGGAHLAVGWKLPDGTMERPIPGSRLSIAAGAVADTAFTAPLAASAPQAPTASPAPVPSAAPAASAAATPPAAAAPHFITAIKLGGGDGVTIDGNKWLSQRQAEASGLVVKNARATALSMEPKPAVDPGMRSMLTGGVTAAGGPLELALHLPNGTYQVYAWYMETTLATARSFDLEINGELMPGLGGLPVGTWKSYGPIDVGVRMGLLDIVAKPKKGSPLLMGVAVYATFDAAAVAHAYPVGTVRVLPCSISCTDYDQGGEGVGYHTPSDHNEGNKYRHDAVGIDDKPGGGFCVGWVRPGEWLAFTVLSPKTTTYTLGVRAGTPATGATCHVEVDGVNVTGRLEILKTGDWKKWAEVVKNGIPMTQGAHVVRLVIDGPGPNSKDIANFDSLVFTAE